MRPIPLLLAAAILFAAPAAAHESIDGTACHMGPAPMATGTVVEQWHCHKNPVEAAERKRRHQCKRRLAKLQKALDRNNEPLANWRRQKAAEVCQPGELL